MQNIERQNIRPQIRTYTKDINPAEKIAGLFYYSSAAILWTAGMFGAVGILLGFLFSPGTTLTMLIIGLICGFPGWAWAGIGVFLYSCHKKHFKSGLAKTDAISMWFGTIAFNAAQAFFIFKYFNVSDFTNFVAGWNLIVVALSLFALYFDLKLLKTTKFR